MNQIAALSPSAPSEMTTIVRVQNLADGALALPLVRAWHAESRFAHLPFSEKKYIETVLAILRRGEKGAAFIVFRGGRPVGLINMAVGEAMLSEGGCYATCLGWFVEPKVRRTLLGGRIAARLLAAAKSWSRDLGASELMIHGTHGIQHRLRRRGNIVGMNVVVDIKSWGVF